MWDKFLDQTSHDGFTHSKPRNLSPRNKNVNTQGNWNNLLQRTSESGFTRNYNQYSGKQKNIIPKDHFEKGVMIVQVNDEGGLWNRKPLIKHNTVVKTSHVFDSVKYPSSSEEIKSRVSQIKYPENNPRGMITTEYSRYYKQDAPEGANKYSEYNNNYKKTQQDLNNDQQNEQFKDYCKKQQRKPLPTPQYMQQFLQYKREHDCLKL